MKIIRAKDRFVTEEGWLTSRFLFSFASYYDPDNEHLGRLRVFNHDEIQAHNGFPTHPHRDAEIVTLVQSGAITHRDTMGNSTTIAPGEIQRMTAGSGIAHSEMNEADDVCELYQIWFLPDERGLTPSYEQAKVPEEKNALQCVASHVEGEGIVQLNALAKIHTCSLEAGKTVSLETARNIFVYVSSGSLTIQGKELQAGDQLRSEEGGEFTIEAMDDSAFVLIEC